MLFSVLNSIGLHVFTDEKGTALEERMPDSLFAIISSNALAMVWSLVVTSSAVEIPAMTSSAEILLRKLSSIEAALARISI